MFLPEIDGQIADINNIYRRIRDEAGLMLSEFNRKKQAYELHKTTLKKSGSLNPSHVWKYKTTEDIFRRYEMKPEGKAHGMFMIIDTSSSMSNVYRNAVMQATTLAVFCKLAHIPFRTATFTSAYRGSVESKGGEGVSQVNHCSMQVIYDSNMSVDDIQNFFLAYMIHDQHAMREGYQKADIGQKIARHFGYKDFGALNRDVGSVFSMGGTPLYKSWAASFPDAYRMIETFKIQNMNYITITDGEDTDGIEMGTHFVHPFTGRKLEVEKNFMKFFNKLLGEDQIKHHVMHIAHSSQFSGREESDTAENVRKFISGMYGGSRKKGSIAWRKKAINTWHDQSNFGFDSVSLIAAESFNARSKRDSQAVAKEVMNFFCKDFGF